MCFTIHTKHPKEKIAKKDIKCYKILDHFNKRTIKSPMQNYIYFKKDKYNKSKIIKINGLYLNQLYGARTYIDRGLYSFSSLKKAHSYSRRYYYWKIHLAIIPKGAKYYFNPETHEYVSTELITYHKTIKK